MNTRTNNPQELNEGCGAEFVHKDVKHPTGVDANNSPLKAACFDGDADRLIYFKNGGKPVVIDGDKQFSLLMLYIVELLQALGLSEFDVSHCLVNTAYANSQALNYIKRNGITTKMVPTGVKNAHPVVQQYVIGANDEPNGHGTICVKWEELDRALAGKEDLIEAKKLRALLRISNVYVGDAISNLLMIEAVLRDRDWSVDTFSSMYEEFPNKMYKAVVTDRTKFKTQWDESRLVDPLELQELIDAESALVQGGRAFVRPSGTEDILRLYVEAKLEADVQRLADAILGAIETRFKDYDPTKVSAGGVCGMRCAIQ